MEDIIDQYVENNLFKQYYEMDLRSQDELIDPQNFIDDYEPEIIEVEIKEILFDEESSYLVMIRNIS